MASLRPRLKALKGEYGKVWVLLVPFPLPQDEQVVLEQSFSDTYATVVCEGSVIFLVARLDAAPLHLERIALRIRDKLFQDGHVTEEAPEIIENQLRFPHIQRDPY